MRSRRNRSLESAVAEARRLLSEGASEEEYLAYTARAVEKFPNDPELRLAYATALAASRPEQARTEALQVVDLDPGDPVRLARLAGLLVSLGARDAARSCVERAAQLPPPANAAVAKVLASQLSNVRGAAAALDGDHAQAEEALRAAYDADPEVWVFARDLAAFLGSRRRFDEALEIIDRTLAASASPDVHAEQSRAILKRLREDIERNMRSPRSNTRLGSPGSRSSTSTSTRRSTEGPTPWTT
jgi:tetratricopeptide (TPR) repeat protein